jgi:hypothetical protein
MERIRFQTDVHSAEAAGKDDSMQLNPYLTFSGQCEAAFKFCRIVSTARHAPKPADCG